MTTARWVAGALIAGLALTTAPVAARTLTVGVSAGPYGDVLRFAADLAAKEGLTVKVVEFTDYTLPNAALAQGDIDFNNFQHKPYLENQIATRGYDLVPIAPSIIVPLAGYSNKITSLEVLPSNALIAIPNDPTNGARALQLLERAGVITLRPEVGQKATVLDVVDNPKKVRFKELDAAQLPRSLDDVTIAVATLNYALAAGLDPKKSLFIEDRNTPWGLWFVTRRADQNDPDILKYIGLYRSDAVKAFVHDRFKGTILTSW